MTRRGEGGPAAPASGVLELHLELVDLEPQPVDLGVVRVQVDDRLVLDLPRSVGVPERDSNIW